MQAFDLREELQLHSKSLANLQFYQINKSIKIYYFTHLRNSMYSKVVKHCGFSKRLASSEGWHKISQPTCY